MVVCDAPLPNVTLAAVTDVTLAELHTDAMRIPVKNA
jgi:hypothetical protein